MAKDLRVKIIVSEDIESQYNGMQQRQIIVNPLIQMRTRFIPTSLSLAVTIIMVGMIPNVEYKIEISLINKQKNKTIFSTGVAEITAPSDTDNFIANVDLKNLEIEDEGTYSVLFKVNEDKYTEDFKILRKSEG